MPCRDVSYTCLTRHVLQEHAQWNGVPWGGCEQKKAVWFSVLPRVDSACWISLEIKILEHSIFHFFYWHISINKVHEVRWQLSTRKEFLESQEMWVWVLDGSFICLWLGASCLTFESLSLLISLIGTILVIPVGLEEIWRKYSFQCLR